MSKKVKYPKGTIRFTIYGNAKAKAMPRFVYSEKTKRIHSYKQKNSYEWERSVTGQSMKYKPSEPFDCPVALGCLFYRQIPKSFSNKKKIKAEEGIIRPITKPDIKNLIANVEDALNKVFWLDDNQIVEYINVDGIPTGKYYSSTPRIEIVIVPLYDLEFNSVKNRKGKL